MRNIITDQTRVRFDDRGPEESRSLNHGHVMTMREFFDVNNEADPDFENHTRGPSFLDLLLKGEWLSEEGGMGSQVYLVVEK